MKKLLYVLFAVTLFTACSSDDDNNAPTQDYTSFMVENKTGVDMTNVVVGYLVDGKYKKLASLGEIKKGATSSETRVGDTSITKVVVFTDYNGTRKVDVDYTLTKNMTNVYVIPSNSKTTPVDKTDPSQYPL